MLGAIFELHFGNEYSLINYCSMSDNTVPYGTWTIILSVILSYMP